MSDIQRSPVGTPMDEDQENGEVEVTEDDYEEGEFRELEATLAEEPTFEDEKGVSYNPAAQAPKEAER